MEKQKIKEKEKGMKQKKKKCSISFKVRDSARRHERTRVQSPRRKLRRTSGAPR